MSRNKLNSIIRSRAGAFDLPSILIAVVTVAVLTAGVLATIFGIIPFTQDNGTKQDIAAVRTAEGAALVKDGKFTDVAGLIAAGYLSEQLASADGAPGAQDPYFARVASTGIMKTAAGVNAKGDCYVALGKSGTGKIFWGSDKTADPQVLTPTDETGCLTSAELKALVDSLGGFEGKYTPSDPEVTGTNPDPTTASFSWNAVADATGYRVESRINGHDWTIVNDNQAETTAAVSAEPSDVIDVRVTARNDAGDSGYGTATVKLPDAIVANGGFENGLTSWIPAGNAQASAAAHNGLGAAKLTATGTTSTLSQTVNVPADVFSSLDFWYTADNYTGNPIHSRTELQIRDSSGAVLATPFTTAADVPGWTKATVDLTNYKGQTVTLTFVQFDAVAGTTSSFDDVVLTTTPPVITAAPTRVGATGDDTTASLVWDAPSSRAVPITTYTVTPYLDGAAQAPVTVTGSPAATAVTITGLTNGGSYTFTVTATNSAGTSPASVASAAVVPGHVLIANAGFEAGLQSWTTAGTVQPSATARTGFGAAKLTAKTQTTTLSQSVTVPANEISSLDFWYTADNYTGNPIHSRTELQIRDSSGAVLATPFTTAADVPGWTKATVDLTNYNGQTVTLTFAQFDAGYGPTTSSFDDLVLTSTPPVITAAPTSVAATADATTATVVWDAPASLGVPITAYTITPYLDGTAQAPVTVSGNPAPTSATLTGLANGGVYTFTVTATNSAGTSAPSAPSAAVATVAVLIQNAGFEADLQHWATVGTAQPSAAARTGLGAAKLTAQNKTSTLSQSVNVPADKFTSLDFWYTADNYASGYNPTYSRSDLQIRNSAGTVLATPFTTYADVPAWTKASVDLTDYKGQTVTLAFVQYDAGYGGTATLTLDDLVTTTTPPVITAAPTRVGVTADDTTASLAWVAPSSRATNVTAYTITPYLNGAAQTPTTVTGNPAPAAGTVTGLTNGASYTFTVTATNTAGTSPESAASAAVVPGAVTIANAGFEAGLKSWTVTGAAQPSVAARTGFGSAAVSAKSQTTTLAQSVNVPADKFTSLDFWYTADNYASGYNPTYSRSDLQIRNSAGTVLATPFTTYADVPAWTKASVDLTDYKGQTVTLAFVQFDAGYGGTATLTLDDLALTSTPPVITAAPTRVGVTADDTTASLAWVAPSSRATNVTAYTITPYLNGAAQTPTTVTGNPAPAAGTVTGLTNGASYTFTVTATNTAGTSPESAASAAVVPGAVTIANAGFEAGLKSWTVTGAAQPSVAARTGFGSAAVSAKSQTTTLAQSVNVPADKFTSLDFWYTADNYATGYTPTYSHSDLQIRNSAGTVLATPFTTYADIPAWTKASVDLTDYKGQTVTLAFVQFDAGYGGTATLTLDDLVTMTTPPVITAAPTRVGVTADDSTASLAWVAPSSRASAITAYTITPYLDGTAQAPTTVTGSPAPTAGTITGLTNGGSYTFTVAASNVAGTSPESVPTAAVVPGPVKIANAGFEAGLKSWTTAGTAQPSTAARTGFGAAKLTSTSAVNNSSISQSVNVPADMFSSVDFWYLGNNIAGRNKTELQILNSAGTLLTTPFSVSGDYNVWTKMSVDLTDYKGQTVVLKFNQHNNSGFSDVGISTIDDLAFTSTPPVITAAPTGVGVAAEDAAVSLAWVAPSSRAVPITAYTITPYLNGAAQAQTTVTGNPAATSATITGLTNGGSYTFTVTATNAAGTSPESAASAAVVPGPVLIANAGFEAGLRSWTTGGTTAASANARTGFGSAVLTSTSTVSNSSLSQSVNVPADMFSTLDFWHLRSNVYGRNKTEMQILNTSGAVLATPLSASSDVSVWTKITVDLTDYQGQTVVLKFNQHNNGFSDVGTSTFDDLVLTSTPPVITAAPTSVGVSADDTTASLAWVAPSSRASAITAYTITPYLNGAAQAPTTVTGNPAPAAGTVTGLTNGGSYTFTVTATNAAGTSPASAASVAVVPGPVLVANAGFEAGLKSWTPAGTAAASSTTRTGVGSATLTSTIAVRDSSISQSVNVPANMISGLEFYYVATNTNAVYNRTELQILSTAGAVLATPFTNSGDNASWLKATVDLTAYQGQTVVLKFNQHNNGYSYTGTSRIDDLAFTSTPAVVAAAPTNVAASGGNTAAYLNWTAPPSPGSTISVYTVTPYLGGAAQTPVTVTGNPAATSAVVTGLTNGTDYTFTVSATNGIGKSPDSAASAVATPSPQPVRNGGFESDLAQWTTGGNVTPTISTTAHTGTKSVLLGNANSAGSNVTQTVTVPNTAAPSLTYWFKAASIEGGCGYDLLTVQARTAPGTTAGPVLKSTGLCTSTGTAWTSVTVPLTAYKGQTIALWFNVQTDGSAPSSALLDDISIAE